MSSLTTIPLTLKQANDLISQWHRHHKPVVGQKFAVGAVEKTSGKVVGAAIASRPVSRGCDYTQILEVSRLVTDGTPNTCSFLYSVCARIAREMGYKKIQTYILQEEPGTSLRAAGWSCEGMTKGGSWNGGRRKGRREDQPLCPKQRWSKAL